MHTEQEKQWAKDVVAKIGGGISSSKVVKLNLIEEYKKAFKKNIGPAGLAYFLREHGRGAVPSDKKVDLSDPKIKFLVIAGNKRISAFRTEKQVKKLFEDLGLLSGLTIFKKVNYKTSYSVKLG